jgi:hypothetical protein
MYAALDTSAYAAFFTESRTRLSDSNKLHRNPGPSWAILSRPYGTDRDKPGELICFQPVRYKSGTSRKSIRLWSRALRPANFLQPVKVSRGGKFLASACEIVALAA